MTDRPHLRGFFVERRGEEPPRAWPEPVTVRGVDVWFHGYLSDTDGARRAADKVAAAYHGKGTEFGQHLRGEFAAVIADGPVLVFGGDRMGLRPLYFGDDDGSVVLSTDLEAIARETRASAIDETYVADLLTEGRHLGTRTPYLRVRRLGIGQAGKWSPRGLTVSNEWQPTITPVAGDLRVHQDRLVQAVDAAVRSATPEGPVAVHLSGGLDSSTVLACLPDGHTVHAISTVYSAHASCDEREWMGESLRRNPAHWHPIDVSRCLPFSAGPDFDHFVSAPSYATITWAQDRRESVVAQQAGATAILTGEGGDEVFAAGVAPWHIADLIRGGHWRTGWQEARRWSSDAPAPRPATYWLLRAGLNGWMRWRRREELAMHKRAPLTVSAPWLTDEYAGSARWAARPDVRHFPRMGRIDQQATVEGILQAAETVRSSYPFSAHGVDTRHPFLSAEMVDVALSTPWQAGVDPRIDRAVQRYAFDGRMSDVTLRRRSKATSDLAIFRGLDQAPDWIELLWESPQIVQRGYVDLARWRESIDRSTVGWLHSVHHFKAAVQVEHWLSQLHTMGAPRLLRTGRGR